MISGASLQRKFLIWRYRNISHRQFILLLSVAVGLLSGLSAVLLKNLTHFIQHALEEQLVSSKSIGFYFVLPAIGFVLTYLIIKYIIRKPMGHGIPSVLYAISKRKSIMRPYAVFASLITAPVTVGFGGSVGLEGPAVSTGAALGSRIARVLHLHRNSRKLILGCAAAGALSAIFKVPITGIIFVIEVFSLDLTMASLVPLLLSSGTALLTSYLFLGQGLTLSFQFQDEFQLASLPYYIAMALVAAVLSIHFNQLYHFISNFFENKLKQPWMRILLGGAVLGTLVYFIPPLYGEGYDTINQLLAGDYSKVLESNVFGDAHHNPLFAIGLLVAMLYLKIVATTVTFGAGGVGGIFAPTLFMGSVMGHSFAKTVNLINPEAGLSVSNFTLVGMCGLMAGILQAPLTAIFLIAETTGGYALIAPLMIVSAISFSISHIVSGHSIYTEELGKKGELVTHNKDKAVLNYMNLDRVLETNFSTVNEEMSLGTLVHEVVAKSKRNLFPVVGPDREFLGMLILDDIRSIMFDHQLYDSVFVRTLMQQPPEVIQYERDNMETVMRKFQYSHAWNLAVVDKDGRYMGCVSRSKLLTVYRRKLLKHSEEQ